LVRAGDDLYFDSVSQVRLPRWSKGRVTLAGDSASCLSLFGEGSTLAMTGAHTLARELAAAPADPQRAFDRYETAHRAVVAPKLNGYRMGAAMLLPSTRAGILTRNTVARAMQAASALRRKKTAA
jgi:2-polyprenyl-6-methoxyphenol hydroxylase-like FAD-dependent oxidoreductase